MAFFVGKTVDFVFHAGAVARTHALNVAGEHGAAVKAAANNLVRAGIGVGDPARHLLRMLLHPTHKAEHRHGRAHAARHAVAGLLQAFAEVDAAPVNAWRCAGFQAALRQLEFFEACTQARRWRIARAAGSVVVHAHMDLAV